MKAKLMLNRGGNAAATMVEPNAIGSPVRKCRGSHQSTGLRALIVAIGLSLTANSPWAQDATAPTTGIPDTDSGLANLEDYVALEKRNGDLEARIQVLEKSEKDLKASLAQQKQALQTATSAAKRFSDDWARRAFSHASRHVAGMAAVSIPYIGADVAVAMTTLDVREACESVKALNEMNRAMKLEPVDETKVCAIKIANREQVIDHVIKNWRTAYAVAAAWANQNEAMLPAEPPQVSYARVNELWTAVYGTMPRPVSPSIPGLSISPTPPTSPTPPVPPSIRRP